MSQIALCINIYRTLFHSQKRKWLMTNDHNDWNSWSLCFMLAASMFHVCGLYVSCLRPLCFMLAASMFHACGLYVSCLRPLSTTHGYDKGRIAFWGARKRLGALAVLCGFERRACKHRGCEAGLKHRGWVCAFGSCFWSFFRGSFFWSFFLWFVLLGARMCFLFDALKVLEACVARSEVS